MALNGSGPGLGKRNKGQVAPFLVLISAVLILAIVATMLIGEAAFQRLRIANIADAGLISSASSFCRGLNQIRMSHTRMLLNYIQLQTALLAKTPWPSKHAGYAAAMGWTLLGIGTNGELYEQAKKIAEDMPKDLRTGLFDSVFGGALIDEPKPFLDTGNYWHRGDKEEPVCDPELNCNDSAVQNPRCCDEVERDESGRIVGLNYERYLKRKSHFEAEYLRFKKGECLEGEEDCEFKQEGGKDKWYKKNLLSYAFNRKKLAVSEHPGKIFFSAPPTDPQTKKTFYPDYTSYLLTQLQDVPNRVSVQPQRMVLLFFYIVTKGGHSVILPGFVPHPCAWIRRIDMDSSIFGMAADKSTQFGPAVYERQATLKHTNKVRIRGSVWSGFDFVLEK